MANLDVQKQTSASVQPLDEYENAATPHGYGQLPDGRTAVKVRPHAPKPTLSVSPDMEETELAGRVRSLMFESRAYRRPMVPMWKRCQNMLYNRYRWGAGRPDWLPSPLVAEIYPICATIQGWVLDQRIGYTVAPAAVPDNDLYNFFQTVAMDLEAVLDASWQANSEEAEWGKAAWDVLTYGTGILKTTWDSTLCGGQGDAVTRRISPFAFYPDPAATNFDDANYFVEVRKMSVQDLDRRFPGAAALFPAGGMLGDDLDIEPSQINMLGQNQPPRANAGAIAPVPSPRYGTPGVGTRKAATDLPGVLVVEAWIREHSTYDGEANGEPLKKVYDTWRVIVQVGNHVLLNEPADNLWSHGKHPYSRFVADDTGEMWGRSLVDLLTPSQVAINRLLSALQQNIELTGNPVWRDATNGANGRTAMTNKPGERIRTNTADNATGWLNPPPMNPQMINLLQYHLARMEALSGMYGITKGQAPPGRPGGDTIDHLQENSFIRIRKILRNLEYAMRDAGYKKASLIVENYTTPRLMAIAGTSGERSSLALKARHFIVPTSEGGTPLKFQLEVDAGSRQHTSRQMREDRAIQLFTLGLITGKEALHAIDYPNAEVVGQEMQDQQMQMAAMGGQAAPGARQRAGH